MIIKVNKILSTKNSINLDLYACRQRQQYSVSRQVAHKISIQNKKLRQIMKEKN